MKRDNSQIFKFEFNFHKSYHMTTEEYSEYSKYVWTTFKVQLFCEILPAKKCLFSN